MSSQDGNLPSHMGAQGGQRSATPGPMAGFYVMWALAGSAFDLDTDGVINYRWIAPYDCRIEEVTFSAETETTTPTYGLSNNTQSTTLIATTTYNLASTPQYWNGTADGKGTLANRNVTKGDVLIYNLGNGAGDNLTNWVFMTTLYAKGHVNVSQAED